MRRAVPVIAATGSVLALLANFHTTPGEVPVARGPAASTSSSPATSPAPTTAPTTSSAGTAATAPVTTIAADPGAPPFQRTIDGPTIPTEWGDVQVRVSLSGTKIVDIVALKLPNEKARSREISVGVEPLLRDEVLKAQSVRVDTISGATVTSEGYLTSLQNALTFG